MSDRYTCIIVDDEPLARRLIQNYLSDLVELECLKECKNALEAIDFLSQNKVDLMFLDIRMPGLTGIGLLEKVAHPPLTVITTAYDEYAVKAFELDVIDYLVKPIAPERFAKAVSKFKDYQYFLRNQQKETEQVYLRTGYGLKRVRHDQILFVEAQKEYMKVVLEDQLPDLVYIRMKELHEQLGEGFVRIHKSYLVNLKKIDGVSGNQVQVGDDRLKISRNYKADVMRRIDGFQRGRQ